MLFTLSLDGPQVKMISELPQSWQVMMTSLVALEVRGANSSMNPCVSISPQSFAFAVYVPPKELKGNFGTWIEIAGNEIGN
jgi:hypothetical protein